MQGRSVARAVAFKADRRAVGRRRRVGNSLVLTAGLLLSFATAAAELPDERWAVEDFSHVLGGGPVGGPADQASGDAQAICGDTAGNLYLAGDQFVDIVTPNGMRSHLAGDGEIGFRDGPAYQAQFSMGVGAYYGTFNLACTKHGIFIADAGNSRIRRLFKKDGQWIVETWAGGGKTRLATGKSATPRDVALRGTLAVAASRDGEVTVANNYGAYRIDAEGARIIRLGDWPESMRLQPNRPAKLNVMMGDADTAGNVYFVSRTPDFVVRIDQDGRISHLAGRPLSDHAKRLEIGDGPPREIYIDTPTSIAADPNGEAIYVCGGDEYDIRRIPADGKGSTATLMQNGRWGVASIHPNRSRGAAVFAPARTGTLRPDGELTDLMVNHLLGRDASGALYGVLRRWVGMTQTVEGVGPLGTRIFRIYRVAN
jgi:hypothetical protein